MHTGSPDRVLDRQVNLRMNPRLYQQLHDLAEHLTTSVSQLIRESVVRDLDRRDRELKKSPAFGMPSPSNSAKLTADMLNSLRE
jgi:hypothetical protein